MKKLGEETIRSVLDGFDFEKMVTAMEVIGWPDGKAVSVAQLRERAEHHLHQLSFDPNPEPDPEALGYCTASYSGFLEARLSFDEGYPVSVELRFIAVSSEDWNVGMVDS